MNANQRARARETARALADQAIQKSRNHVREHGHGDLRLAIGALASAVKNLCDLDEAREGGSE